MEMHFAIVSLFRTSLLLALSSGVAVGQVILEEEQPLGVDLAPPVDAQFVAPQPMQFLRPQPGQPIQPVRAPNLHDAIQAKYSEHDGVAQVVFLADAFRDELKEVQITQFRQQTVIRQVPNPQGELVAEEIVVNVPFVEPREVLTRVPAGKKPIAVPAEECFFYSIHGQQLDAREAAERLPALRAVLLLDNTANHKPELATVIREVLNPDCLIVITEKRIRESPPHFHLPVIAEGMVGAPVEAIPLRAITPALPRAK
jgi:hypothetical protein